jgi:dihydrofolate reductase
VRLARLSLIAAVAKNGVIGRDNAIPWRLPSDLKRFKNITMGKPVVMGRKTFESIGKPLPGRTNIVVSRDPAFRPSGALVDLTLSSAIERARRQAARDGTDEVFIIGGGKIYEEAMPLADRLCITEVDAAPDGDAHFPKIDPGLWREVERGNVAREAGDSAASVFVVYDRPGRAPD